KKFCLALSPDGKTLAAAGTAELVYLLDPVTLEQRRTLTGNAFASVSGLAFTPDGRQLLTSSGGSRSLVWNLGDGTISTELPYAGWVLAFSRDGKHLAGTAGRVWTWRRLKYAEWHIGRALAFIPPEIALRAGNPTAKSAVSAIPGANDLHC